MIGTNQFAVSQQHSHLVYCTNVPPLCGLCVAVSNSVYETSRVLRGAPLYIIPLRRREPCPSPPPAFETN